eukprot:CAMPEP_0194079694 /NCGR_PEP_ID=MMETSP0149-20130528/5850_1 /TAXON_ID=122233 /ORGANISM="Chaetoceros debilis, Strain MM31A-1" /LENGTH=460 /DNA_ID=CAMNT_0038761247 /DNA_START=71 /DNA_END=1453 /DNA_ORIENTATION=-
MQHPPQRNMRRIVGTGTICLVLLTLDVPRVCNSFPVSSSILHTRSVSARSSFPTEAPGVLISSHQQPPNTNTNANTNVNTNTNSKICLFSVRPNSSDFLNIFTGDVPLLDVRADVEFTKGAFPTSVNIPILDDEQRRLVGTCYKEQGPEAAFDMGRDLMNPEIQAQRIHDWTNFIEAHPNGFLYCFRGGSRSNIAQQELKKVGIDFPLVEGGYKAMRTFLIEDLEKSIKELPMVMIGGRTGSGKTHLLKRLPRHVDLEGLANHRGSTFGRLVDEETTQINFENSLAIEFLQLRNAGPRDTVFIEEEGNRIGRRTLPVSMYHAMVEHLPTLILDTPIEERVRTCVQDYVTDLFPLFESAYKENAHEIFRKRHLDGIDRIKKRLGGKRHGLIHHQVSAALDLFESSGDTSGFYEPTETVLREYYDPMYDYQSNKQRKGPVLFQGDAESLIDWAEKNAGKFLH